MPSKGLTKAKNMALPKAQTLNPMTWPFTTWELTCKSCVKPLIDPWSKKGLENAWKPYPEDHHLKDGMIEWKLI